MITRQRQQIVAIPFDELLDPKTGKTRIRMLDVKTESFATAMALQTRLLPTDLDESALGPKLVELTRLDLAALEKRFG